MSRALAAALAAGDLTTAMAELYDQDDFGGRECHAALQAVLALHVRTETNCRSEGVRVFCDHCETGEPYCTTSSDWPCPTVAAITNGLKVER